MNKKTKLSAYRQILYYDRYLDRSAPDAFYQEGLVILEKMINAYRTRYNEGRRLSLHRWATARNLLNAYNLGI